MDYSDFYNMWTEIKAKSMSVEWPMPQNPNSWGQPNNIGWSYIDPVAKYTELVSDLKPTLLPPDHGVFYYPASGLTALNSFWSRWARL